MKLGICYPYDLDSKAALSLIAECEKRGLDSIWVVENPGWPGAFATAGAVAAITRRMLVSIGVVSAFTRSPAALAIEAGQLQKLSDGRFRFGVGMGSVRVLEELGIDTSHPVESISETIGVLRSLFTGGVEGHRGKRHTIHRFKLTFDFGAPPPIFIGTMGPKMTVLAGKIADGLIISTHTPLAEMKETVNAVRGAAELVGRPRNAIHVTAFLIASLHSDVAQARDLQRPRLAIDVWRIARNIPSFAGILKSVGLSEEKIRAIKEAPSAASIVHLMEDSVIDGLCFAGNAEAFHRRLRDLQAIGVDEVVLFHAPEDHGFIEHLDGLVSGAKSLER